jgi:hypothetical protein
MMSAQYNPNTDFYVKFGAFIGREEILEVAAISVPPKRRTGLLIWLIVSKLLALASLLIWALVAGLSVMAFDQGSSTEA